MSTYKVYTLADGTRYVSLVLKPHQGHIFTGTKQQVNRRERQRNKK